MTSQEIVDSIFDPDSFSKQRDSMRQNSLKPAKPISNSEVTANGFVNLVADMEPVIAMTEATEKREKEELMSSVKVGSDWDTDEYDSSQNSDDPEEEDFIERKKREQINETAWATKPQSQHVDPFQIVKIDEEVD